jgi:hypothetical protein
MPAFEDAPINEMLDWFNGVANPPAIATRYITVFDGDPQSGGSEVINTLTGSPNRIAYTGSMAAASGGTQASNAPIVFTASAAGAADVDWVAIFDAQTGGNRMGQAQVNTPKSVGVGDSLTILSGNLTFAII